MSTDNQAEFKGWARVEVMGHQSHVGFVTTEAYGQAVLFRIDQPEIAEVEETLQAAEWTDLGRMPAGTVVKRGRIEGVSVLVGSGSIYRIIPCSEAAALKAIRESQRRPLMIVKLAEGKALEPPVSRDFSCCSGNPEDGHEAGCPHEFDDESEAIGEAL